MCWRILFTALTLFAFAGLATAQYQLPAGGFNVWGSMAGSVDGMEAPGSNQEGDATWTQPSPSGSGELRWNSEHAMYELKTDDGDTIAWVKVTSNQPSNSIWNYTIFEPDGDGPDESPYGGGTFTLKPM
jgi:hypothetical protein